MPSGLETVEDGVELVRLCVGGARVVRVLRTEENDLVLRFDNGASLALSGPIGVGFPAVGAAVLGEMGDWV